MNSTSNHPISYLPIPNSSNTSSSNLSASTSYDLLQYSFSESAIQNSLNNNAKLPSISTLLNSTSNLNLNSSQHPISNSNFSSSFNGNSNPSSNFTPNFNSNCNPNHNLPSFLRQHQTSNPSNSCLSTSPSLILPNPSTYHFQSRSNSITSSLDSSSRSRSNSLLQQNDPNIVPSSLPSSSSSSLSSSPSSLDTLTTVAEQSLSNNSSSSLNGSSSHSASKKRRSNLPKKSTMILLNWLNDNLDHPYPNSKEKMDLIRKTGLTSQQLSNWFINARRRKIQLLRDIKTTK